MFSVTRRISEYRSTVILIILVGLSLSSLATGTRGSVISRGVDTVTSVLATPIWKALEGARGGVAYLVGLVFDYDAGRNEADALRRQLQVAMQHAAERAELEAENERLRRLLEFRSNESRLTLQPAKILEPARVLARPEGTLILDHGSMHGIREAMCVISTDGIVGIVARVEPTLSYVYTLHHANCKIGAVIRRNRVHGIVHGSGSEFSHICSLQYIDLKDDVGPGDEVVTSGGSVFPGGYPIGTVTYVPDTDSLLKMAYVAPAADPYRLDEVFIVLRSAMSADELAGGNRADEVIESPPDADALPDTRTFQERYAP